MLPSRPSFKAYLDKLVRPIELSPRSMTATIRSEMRELAGRYRRACRQGQRARRRCDARKPSFSVGRQGEAARIRFAGIPMGHEFTSLVLALLQTGGHPPRSMPP
jgi:alkyl hydroperoxide reductase subunit F